MKKNLLILVALFVQIFLFSLDVKERIAVLDFKVTDNTTKVSAQAVNEMLVTKIVEYGKYNVVEKSQINKILEVLSLQNSDEFAEDFALEIGKLAKAKLVILGSISKAGYDTIINARAVNVETGDIVFAKSVNFLYKEELSEKIDDLALLLSNNVNENESKDTKKLSEIQEKMWKNRHFFDLLFGIGPAINYNTKSIYDYPAETLFGVDLTLTLGYQYGINRNFAIGPGFTLIMPLSIWGTRTPDSARPNIFMNYYGFVKFWGVMALLQMVIGDLYKNRAGFVLDIGGGWWACVKAGFFVKNFVFKVGYALTGLPESGYLTFEKVQPFAVCHNISFEFGVKFNWKNKSI